MNTDLLNSLDDIYLFDLIEKQRLKTALEFQAINDLLWLENSLSANPQIVSPPKTGAWEEVEVAFSLATNMLHTENHSRSQDELENYRNDFSDRDFDRGLDFTTTIVPSTNSVTEFNSLTASISDTVGDAEGAFPFSDITALQVDETATTLTFQLNFADLSQGAYVDILLDLDGNRQTHNIGTVTEAIISVQSAILGITEAFYVGPELSENLVSWIEGNSLFVELPKSLLPANTDNLEIAAIASSDLLCSGWDRSPNQGYWRLSDGQIHIDNEGLNLPTISWLNDTVGDANEPVDLQGIEIEAIGEHLVFRHYFNHSITSEDISDAIAGSISLDLDGNILTGFANVFEKFPTFGIDARIDYYQYPWALGGDFEATLIYEPNPGTDLVEVNIGNHWTDSCYRIGDNWLEVSIHLSLLPPITEQAVVLSDALAPLGDMDWAPNQGGIRLTDGSIEPFLTWGTPEYSISDPTGDSYAFGYDNDDITEVKASRYLDGILMQVDYTDLRLEGLGMTVIDFDLDRDSDTDISLAFDGYTAILINGSSGEIIQSANSLVTVDFGNNSAYVNIPDLILGSSENIDVVVRTIDPDYGLLYDRTDNLTIQRTANATNPYLGNDWQTESIQLEI